MNCANLFHKLIHFIFSPKKITHSFASKCVCWYLYSSSTSRDREVVERGSGYVFTLTYPLPYYLPHAAQPICHILCSIQFFIQGGCHPLFCWTFSSSFVILLVMVISASSFSYPAGVTLRSGKFFPMTWEKLDDTRPCDRPSLVAAEALPKGHLLGAGRPGAQIACTCVGFLKVCLPNYEPISVRLVIWDPRMFLLSTSFSSYLPPCSPPLFRKYD